MARSDITKYPGVAEMFQQLQKAQNEQTFECTANQDTFVITNGSYTPNTKTINAYIEGSLISRELYTEVDSKTIKLNTPRNAGDLVTLIWLEGKLPVAFGHNSTHYKGGQDEVDITKLANFKEEVSDKISSLQEVKLYTENYLKQGAETDDTARIQRAIDAAPEYATIQFKANKTYNLSSLTITKSLTLDLNGCKIIADPTTNGVNGSPLFWFKGEQSTSSYMLLNCTEKTNDIILSNVNDAANFSVGDYVILSDNKVVPAWDNGVNNTQGYTGRSELTSIRSISGSTLTLMKPIEWSYDTSPKITKITKVIQQPKIINGAYITEVDPLSPYSGGLYGAVPHLFHFQYCIEPKVDNCNFDRWQLHAVNFHCCVNPRLGGSSGTYPFRPSEGGHGYFVRYDHCTGGITSGCYSKKVRHMVDYAQSYEGHSENNVAYEPVFNAFYMHGIGSKRCSSSHDKVIGGSVAGWSMGNSQFSADYGYTIINPIYVGTSPAITMQAKAVGMRVVSPDIQTTDRAFMVTAGADGLSVIGGKVELVGDTATANFLLARPKIGLSDTYGENPKDISISNLTLVGNGNIAIESVGRVKLIDLKGSISTTATAAILIYNVAPIDVDIQNNRISGSFPRGVQVSNAPTKSYNITDNFIDGHTVAPMSLAASSNLKMFHNVSSNGAIVFTGDLSSAKTGGAILFGNTPDTNDAINLKASNVTISKTGDGAELLKFMIERDWSFRQKGTGSNTQLELRPNQANKTFVISANDGSSALEVVATDDANGASTAKVDGKFIPNVVTGTGAPTVNAHFIGQMYINTSAGSEAVFTAVKTGTGATDWKQISN